MKTLCNQKLLHLKNDQKEPNDCSKAAGFLTTFSSKMGNKVRSFCCLNIGNVVSSSVFRERKQESLQGECETRMALLWQEDGKPIISLFWRIHRRAMT